MPLPASVLQSLPAERWQADVAPYVKEWRGLFRAQVDAVACPASTSEVATLLAACHAERVAVVPQGGNTGLVGGSVPFTDNVSAAIERPNVDCSAYAGVLLLSLSAMNRIRSMDADNFSMTVDAGCVLADVQAAAEAANRYFPLSIVPNQQCQIGGNLASNCGGINVLRYGNSRDLCLGIEAVTADGRVLKQLSALRKNNMGYSLRDLLIGSEGTLAVITAAVLKLFPRPTAETTLMLSLDSAEQAVAVLAKAREALGDTVSGCELLSQTAYQFALQYGDNCQPVFEQPPSWCLLLQFSGFEPDLLARVQAWLATLEIKQAVLAADAQQAEDLWRIRKSVPAAQSKAGASIKHDVSVAVSQVPELLRRGIAAVEAAMPGIRACPFGHLGDGNLHFNLTQPEAMQPADFLAKWQTFNRLIHDIVNDLNGSVAAEHGVGQLKLGELQRYADPVALELMAATKKAWDPHWILNPGKLLQIG